MFTNHGPICPSILKANYVCVRQALTVIRSDNKCLVNLARFVYFGHT